MLVNSYVRNIFLLHYSLSSNRSPCFPSTTLWVPPFSLFSLHYYLSSNPSPCFPFTFPWVPPFPPVSSSLFSELLPFPPVPLHYSMSSSPFPPVSPSLFYEFFSFLFPLHYALRSSPLSTVSLFPLHSFFPFLPPHLPYIPFKFSLTFLYSPFTPCDHLTFWLKLFSQFLSPPPSPFSFYFPFFTNFCLFFPLSPSKIFPLFLHLFSPFWIRIGSQPFWNYV